jgi:hypothetical protein
MLVYRTLFPYKVAKLPKSFPNSFNKRSLGPLEMKMKMKFISSLIALVPLISLSGAIPTPVKYTLHEKRSSPSRLWKRSERADRDAILPLRIGLTQNNLDDGYAHLMAV